MRYSTRIVLMLALVGCGPLPSERVPDLVGRVDFGPQRSAQATLGEVASYATVSIIDAATSQSVSTALTDSSGAFVFSFNTWKPSTTATYYLEAIKGLKSNQAGNAAVRLRTIGKYADGVWQTITRDTVVISRSTTALSLLASLKGFNAVPPQTLLSTVQSGVADPTLTPATPDTFNPTGTGLTKALYQQAFNNVDTVMASDRDPMGEIALSSDGGTEIPYLLSVAAPTVTYVEPSAAPVGGSLTVYGSHFSESTDGNLLTFPGGGSVHPTTAQRNRLVLSVPVGAQSGRVLLQSTGGTASFDVTIIPDIGGQYTGN
ncbi:MAG TPA: hypothetical protein V6D05_18625 [Stenomitos sp.]